MSDQPEYTGGSVSYYAVDVNAPINEQADPYTAECQDIIDALGMTFNEGSAFKAIWRRAAARNLGKAKRGYDNGLYDAQKVEFYGKRLVAASGPVATVVPQTAPVEWIEHDGKGVPVPDLTMVYWRRHNGDESGPHKARVFPAGDWQWDKPGVYTISAYRLA